MGVVDGKRIAKNTMLLYVRMGLIMLVSLYTVRILKNSLGDVDYGLNDVVGTLIIIFAFVNGTLASATTRFLSYNIGKGDSDSIKKVFATSFRIHSILAIIVLILGEIVGVYAVNNLLVIPQDRLYASNWVFQFSVISSILSILQAPLNALVISHERMNIYAYVGIFEAIAKCIVAYLIYKATVDKLILLSMLNAIVSVIIFCFYKIYTSRYLGMPVNLFGVIDRTQCKSMLKYTTWSLLGATASMMKNSGLAILINLFFGPVINTANAIANRANSAVANFSNNFTMAINPQIIKAYASKQFDDMKRLIYRGGKVTFFLLMYLCLPLIFDTEYILRLWLNEIPEYCVIFTKLVLILTLIESFTYTIGYAIQATGNIRNYQLIVSGINLLNFPITFVFFYLGFEPTIAICISISLSAIALMARLYFMKIQLGIKPQEYIVKVLFRSISTLLLSIILPYVVYSYMFEGLNRLLMLILAVVVSNTIFIWFVGIDKAERGIIISKIKNR